MKRFRFIAVLIIFFCTIEITARENTYPWLGSHRRITFRVRDIPLPDGFERTVYEAGSFGDWLQDLPIRKGQKKVRLYNGQWKTNQSAHAYILDMDIGDENLQQCADTVIRLYAEYLYSIGAYDRIAFRFTSGDLFRYKAWRIGIRPKVTGDRVIWEKTAKTDTTYQGFREYLNVVFLYAGSHSLSRELKSVYPPDRMEIGHVFIRGGFPGHAMIVVDMAVHPKSGRKIFLLVQGYMPAQDAHVLRNPKNRLLSPWFEVRPMKRLFTPEYNFNWMDLKCFQE
ncbi:DUF4846 domain-containing protein [bacterium]|nr:DUF4846 domain-containing protein [bacterium]